MKSIFSTIALIATAFAETIDVKVGENGLTIEPSNINARQGDDVVFHFFSGNHDVASGPFASPCTPSDNGFYSGIINANGNQPDATFTVRINNTNPIWLYCTTSGHCQSGMSAVINPPRTGNTLDAYKAASKNANSVRPPQVRGGIFSADGKRNSGGASTSSSSSGTPSSTGAGARTGTSTGAGTGTGTATASATGATGTGAASTILTEKTMLFNAFAAIVAAGVGWVGLL
ncbi:hypothetical protein PABG_04842 [Paracoccidioides brasiliensis Pb03]|nr:hypothetical protein PABG_04842 [Paracoccidioides brasiliensis Pb03]